MSIEGLIPDKKQKPAKWGERTKEWERLDRPTLMELLQFVRKRYLEKCREHFLKEFTQDEIETHRACLIVLEAVRQDTLKLFEKVPDELFMEKPENEKWSYHDLLNHLITDEDGEFFPGPPDSILHRIQTDCVHLRQLGNFMRNDRLLPPANHYDK